MKKIISLLLTAGSISLFVLIVFNASYKENGGNKQPFSISEEKSINNPSAIAAKDNKNQNSYELRTASGEKNMTENLIEELTNTFVVDNPNKTQSADVKGFFSLDPDHLADEVLQKGLSEFDYSSLKPRVSYSDLNIIQDANDADIQLYFEQYASILLDKNFKNPASAKDLYLAYKKAEDQLYVLKVPEELAEFHKKTIELFGAKKNIYEKAARLEEDPLAALLALKYLDAVNQEIADLYRFVLKL